MTRSGTNIQPVSVRRTSAPGSRRSAALGWIARLTFVLCGLIVLFMAIHGDEHGRRPRFVWQSSEPTIKIATLHAPEPLARRAADKAPPPALPNVVSTALPVSPWSRPAAWYMALRHPAKLAAYLRPFANGPPSRG